MLYITLLDQFHPGIYSSQVIDVCDYLNTKHKANIRVVAFLSLRELVKTDAKRKLKELFPKAIVLPSFPGLKNFELTAIFLFFICLFTGERVALCRNVFCTRMALRAKKWGMLKKVVMDGRSAMAAEIGEYDVFPVDYLRTNIKKFEAEAVNGADFRIAVSNKLIEYWRAHYQYNKTDHVVIPCTLDQKYFSGEDFKLSNQVLVLKEQMGILTNDIVLVYAGSTAPWQSFALLEKMFVPLLETNSNIKVLFLSKESKDNKSLQARFPGRIIIRWVQHHEVPDYLACGDYGILVREQSDTNKVASPTKFAEYLYAGLPVLISENLGDFSDYVRKNNCGYVLSENEIAWSFLGQTSLEEKKACFKLAMRDFMKESECNAKSYSELIESLTPQQSIALKKKT